MIPSFNNSTTHFYLFLVFFLSLCSTKVSSLPVGFNCPGTPTYTPNSIYQTNLNKLFSVLSSNATTISGFYNFSVGLNPPDIAYGLFLCRGDVSTDDCRNCVTTATKEVVQLCQKEKIAIIWYDNCLLRFSDQYIFSNLYQSISIRIPDPDNVTDPNSFQVVLGRVMNDVATRASESQSGKKFATSQADLPSAQKLYGLAQCTPDISSSDCDSCLRDSISSLTICCDGRRGGRILYASCNIRYELFPFYNDNVTSTASVSSPTLPVLPPPRGPTSTPGKGRILVQVIIAIFIPIGVSFLLFIVCFCLLIRKTKKKYDVIAENTVGSEITTMQSLQYDFSIIQAATNNFCDNNKIGEGGFGCVYKGTLLNRQEIAVKRLSRNSGQGAEEFKNEVLLLAKLQHRNLVKLLGFCLKGEEKILVYEFVPNKSLDYIIFDPQQQEKLDWPKRHKIIEGIARGMLYLHEESRLKIIHRDLKASNILLDGNMNAKISDFGMARIFSVDQSQGNTRRIVGTFGYMPPEYAMRGQFSVKSDIFSFGVLILEIISGKKNNSFYQSDCTKNLISYAWKLWRDRTPLELMDPILKGSYSRDEVTRCIHIGLLCIQEDPNARPSMATVILMLDSYSVTLSIPQEPAFLFHGRTRSNPQKNVDSHEPTSKLMPCSVNEVSITELDPR